MSVIESKARNVGFGWEAIDIFLFSNGQNSSPPRKYHLRTDELDWWEATLNHLAKSHYGSSHTAIELYTLSGSRIEGPQELCDGMPCVAVVPPDTFTDAGYENYLMKASRSFEKRKIKNANMTDQAEVRISDSPQIDNEKQQPVYATDHTTLNAPEKSITEPTATLKSLKSTVQKSVLPNMRNEKRRSILARTSFMKTQIKSTKNFNQDSQRKRSLKTNEPISETTDKSNENKSLSASPPIGVPTSTPKSSMTNTPLRCHTMVTVNSKDLFTDYLPLENLISEKQILLLEEASNLYQNPVHEVKSVKLDAYVVPTNMEEVNNCVDSIAKTRVDEEIQTKIETSSCEVNTALYSPPSNSKIKVIAATVASQSNIMKCDTPLGDNYIAVINKGDAVNLKLQIEVQNGSSHTNKQSSSNWKNVRETNSLSDIFKKRKSSNTGDDVVTATKSLESVVCGINECYTKVVVVQCSCCGNKTTMARADKVPVYKDPNGFFILIPTTPQQENHSCLCFRDENPCPDKNAMSALCVEEFCKPESSAIYPCVQEVGMVMTLTGSFGSQTEEQQRNGADKCIVAKTVLGNMMSRNKERYTVDECMTSPSRIKQKLEYMVATANIDRSLSRGIIGRVDSYTQTEWCSILLEAHLHEDGRYSFHFPSLQALKHYSLI
ncbi:unnamed protein product [Arctia plantaginis]|uniref:Doublecortin domain-containing protein n=1 Tax=Arctia plantaginis TaxID=874455 RepID=A0A8S0YP12_ARCPL|nr:unnamed protein product [Arctia plantaginis]